MLTLRILLAQLLFFGITSHSPASAIESGLNSPNTPYATPIYIQTSSGTSITCGGAPISRDVVVTAAHCLVDQQGKVLEVVKVGEPGSSYAYTSVNINSWVSASAIKIHPNFSKSLGTLDRFDIAFIKLSKSLNIASPIRIANEIETSLNALPVEISVFGYGKSGDGANSTWPEFPSELKGEIVRNYNDYEFVSSSENQKICLGDSGSPVLIRQNNSYKLLGVVSRSGGGGDCGTYDFASTKIRPFLGLATELGFVEDLKKEKEYVEIENKLASLRVIFDEYTNRFQNLSTSLMSMFEKNKAWQKFKKSETNIFEIEDLIMDSGFTQLDNAKVLKEIENAIKIQNLLIIEWKRKLPKFQCYDSDKGEYSLLIKGKCPRGYLRIKI